MLLTPVVQRFYDFAVDYTQHLQGQGPAEIPDDLSAWDWKGELKRQERSLEWLARRTQRSTSAVNGYSSGRLTPPLAWLQMARSVLARGME